MKQEKILKVDVAIIGAGWYGLAAARTYLKLQPTVNLLIIDSDSTVGGLFNYSDKPMRPHGGNPNDPRVTGEMIHGYLQEYAEDHDLIRRIRFNTFVETATKCDRGWRLALQSFDDVVETQKLLVATGVTSIPFMPNLSIASAEPIPLIHSKDLGSLYEKVSDPGVQNVVVVGAAKSAYDAVYLLLTMGKKVTWLIRSQGGGPLAILPFKILNLVNSIAFASTRLMTHLSPSILNTQGVAYWFFQRTFIGLWFVSVFWSFLDYISGLHAGYGAGDHVQMLTPEIDRQSVFWAHSGLGVVTLPNFWETLHAKSLNIRRDEIKSLESNGVVLKSGLSHSADLVVMCTGWADHFTMFNTDQKAMIGLPEYGVDTYSSKSDAEGQRNPSAINWESYDMAADREVDARLPFIINRPKLKFASRLDPRTQKKWRLYKRAIPVEMALKGDRSLVILGQIHTIQTPLVSEVQSLWAIHYLQGELPVPDLDTMATEVALWNAWTRKRYLNQGQKFPYSLYDFLPYVDSLFKDLGLNSRRKTNPVSEMLVSYRPNDFRGFVNKYMDQIQRKRVRSGERG
ncbi:hypothetical protein BDP81DRAFT_510787 [Colletotrichum phormii]|uniref:FAD-dependent monooxygenase DEP4 n=1 Tax=Colletotrichum phormii TaxID=359342 RepID=A0AAJ0E8N7_9PEZI|nr:uncharacterized protein BDP81DRAFT_510787 [Colletotrichum phormii]KAK1621870.1 hypothetical protein BDP81DRAFT_510787 [Colletotrichum phormii]